ncbi:MAG: type II toxin-antitoxin system CcdA family antitoxin [Pseudomonadota bacterium]
MEANQRRRPTNLSLDDVLIAEARALDVNLSRAAEEGIRREVRRAQAEIWQRENRQALESSNAYAAENGVPLATFRQF